MEKGKYNILNFKLYYIIQGKIDITGNSAFDYDGTAQKNGGTIIINGTETNTITNQMMGGGMKGGRQGGIQNNGEGQMNPNDQMQNSRGKQSR